MENTIPDYFNSINNNNRFFYLVVIILSVYLFTRVYLLDLHIISGLLIGLFIVYILNEYSIVDISDFNKSTELKLNAIINATQTTPRIGGIKVNKDESGIIQNRTKSAIVGYSPKYLYNSVDIINLLYDILDIREYSPNVYLGIVENVDILLKLQEEFENYKKLNSGSGTLDQCTENLEVAKDHMNLALNNMQSFIYSIPSNKFVDRKFSKSLERLQVLLLRITDNLYRSCKLQDSNLNTYRKPSNVNGHYTGPRGNDIGVPGFNLNFDIFN